MKLDRPPGKMPELTRLGGLIRGRGWGRGLSLLGICLITAVIGGPASWASGASPNTQVHSSRLAAFVAVSTPQTITFDQPLDTMVGEPVTLSASAAPGLTVSFTSNTPAVCAVAGSAVTTMTAGVCVITASQDGDATYAPAPEVARSFQVTAGQATQTITFTQPGEMTAGVSVSLSAPTSSGLEATFTSSTPAVCTVSGSTVQTVTGGTCTITASQGGSATYAAAAAVTQSFRVTTGTESQTVSFTLPPEVSSGVPVGQTVALSATATSGLQVSFTSDTPQVCTISGPTVLTVGRGTCTITASQGGSETYQPASQGCIEINERATAGNQGCFEVYTGGEPQVINFSQPPDTQVGVPVTLLATATSGLPVSFASNTARVCTVSGSTVLTAAAGMCMVTASQSGNKVYAPAQAQRRFMVKPGQTITFTQPLDSQVNAHVPLTATASSELQVLFASSTTGVCTVMGSTATTLTVGTCTITATQGGNNIWAPADPVQRSFTVAKVAQTITFDSPPDSPAHTQVHLTATASSELQVSFASSTTGVCTVSGTMATAVKAGICTITASQDGNGTWAAATPVKRSFTVTKAGQTIIFDPPPDTQVNAHVTLSAKATPSGLQVSFTSGNTDVCTVTGSIATTVKAGTCTITASQDGNDTWAAATPVKHSFNVNPAGRKSQTIAFAQPSPAAVGKSVALAASASSGLTVSFTSSTTDVCTVAGPTATTVKAGTCTITASQGGNADYTAARDVMRSFQVQSAGKKSQKIAFAQPSPAAVGKSVALAASASSGLTVSFASGNTAVCTVSGSTATTVATGTCPITASQGGNADYGPAADVTRSFAVNPAGQEPQEITFAPPKGTKVGEPVALSASASSGLPVSFASNTPGVCTVAGPTVTPVAAGTCVITASQSGDAAYAPAPDVPQSFAVNAAGRTVNPARHKPQTITFTPPPETAVGEPVALSASASSGLPVSFASNTPAVCEVAGSTVTTMAGGACMITASQGGNASYVPAREVMRSFQVDPAGRPVNPAGHKSQAITFDPPSQAKAGDPVTLSASASSGLPVAFTSDTPPVCTVSGSTVITMAAGACTVTASQDGSTDYAAAPSETRSFQVNPAAPSGTGPLVFLLAGAVMAATGVAAGVRRLRLRSRRPLVHAPNVRAVPEPGPPGRVDVQDTGPNATRTVRIESSPGTSITTTEEARP